MRVLYCRYAQYHAASVALEDREARIAEAAERIEADMELIGATAVEDKLQVGAQSPNPHVQYGMP